MKKVEVDFIKSEYGSPECRKIKSLFEKRFEKGFVLETSLVCGDNVYFIFTKDEEKNKRPLKIKELEEAVRYHSKMETWQNERKLRNQLLKDQAEDYKKYS